MALLNAHDPVERLDLPMRAYNAFKRNGIDTVGLAFALSDADVLRMRYVGPTTLAELRECLAQHEVRPATDPFREVRERRHVDQLIADHVRRCENCQHTGARLMEASTLVVLRDRYRSVPVSER